MNEGEFPDLRILPTKSLVLHEETDPHRTARLTEVLAQEQILKNPPIVAPIPDSSRYVVLDGANRTMSLRALALPHILVQVIEYDTVQLDTWNHVVTGMDMNTLFACVGQVDGLLLELGNLSQARQLLTARRCMGYMIRPSGEVYIMRGGNSLLEEAELLNKIVRAYKGIGKIHRIKTDIAKQDHYDEPIVAIFVFPPFTPADIINIATMLQKMPTGITRHIIPRRALRLNYPFTQLADTKMSLAEKNEALKDFIRDRLQTRSIRFYQESTVLFDE